MQNLLTAMSYMIPIILVQMKYFFTVIKERKNECSLKPIKRFRDFLTFTPHYKTVMYPDQCLVFS